MKLKYKEFKVDDEVDIPKDGIVHTEEFSLQINNNAPQKALRIYYFESEVFCMNCGQHVEVIEHKLKSIPCPNPKCKKEIIL